MNIYLTDTDYKKFLDFLDFDTSTLVSKPALFFNNKIFSYAYKHKEFMFLLMIDLSKDINEQLGELNEEQKQKFKVRFDKFVKQIKDPMFLTDAAYYLIQGEHCSDQLFNNLKYLNFNFSQHIKYGVNTDVQIYPYFEGLTFSHLFYENKKYIQKCLEHNISLKEKPKFLNREEFTEYTYRCGYQNLFYSSYLRFYKKMGDSVENLLKKSNNKVFLKLCAKHDLLAVRDMKQASIDDFIVNLKLKDEKIVDKIMQFSKEIKYCEKSGKNLLFYCIEENNLEAVKAIVENKLLPKDGRNTFGYPYLYHALSHKKLKIAEYLFEQKFFPEDLIKGNSHYHLFFNHMRPNSMKFFAHMQLNGANIDIDKCPTLINLDWKNQYYEMLAKEKIVQENNLIIESLNISSVHEKKLKKI